MLSNKDIDSDALRRMFSKNKTAAEKFFALCTEIDDYRIDAIITDPTFKDKEIDDPKAVILMIKGYNKTENHPVIMAFLEPRKNISLLLNTYIALIWGTYDPKTDKDFEDLPDIYEIVLGDDTITDTKSPILHIRTYMKYLENGKWIYCDNKVKDGVYINVINTRNNNSDIMNIIGEYVK